MPPWVEMLGKGYICMYICMHIYIYVCTYHLFIMDLLRSKYNITAAKNTVLDTILNILTIHTHTHIYVLMMCMLIKALNYTPKIINIINYISIRLKNNNSCQFEVFFKACIKSPSIYIWAHWISSGLSKWSKATPCLVCVHGLGEVLEVWIQTLTNTHYISKFCTDSVMFPSLCHNLQL